MRLKIQVASKMLLFIIQAKVIYSKLFEQEGNDLWVPHGRYCPTSYHKEKPSWTSYFFLEPKPFSKPPGWMKTFQF